MALADRFQRFIAEADHSAATIDGVTWRCHSMGQGSTALVIMPGAVGGSDLFFVVFQEVQPQRVVGVDLPFVEDAPAVMASLDRLLESHGVERAIFLGASYSGMFIQAFARRYPARTAALILSHTGALDPDRASRLRVTARRAAKLPMGVTRLLLRLLVRVLLRGVNERRFWTTHYDAVVASLSRADVVSRYALGASIEDLGDPPWRGPVLVIHSDNDAIARPAEQAKLRRQYPDAEWALFKGTGHSSYSRDPLAYAAVVRAFVERHRRAAVPASAPTSRA